MPFSYALPAVAILQLALLYHRARLSALTHGLQPDAWMANMGAAMRPVALWGASGFRSLVLKAQESLSVVVEDLVNVLGRQV
jgi:hypothetical protein